LGIVFDSGATDGRLAAAATAVGTATARGLATGAPATARGAASSHRCLADRRRATLLAPATTGTRATAHQATVGTNLTRAYPR
jgi:hypothetical protein